ncbi:MAG: hypothetical protein V4463_07535 [Pseudomonadota bacterium]
MSDFYKYFKKNMEELGLPAPESLYGDVQLAIANVAIFLGHIDKFGKAVTVAEVVGAGTRLEKIGVVGTLSAAYYAGAVIGSLAVATGRSLSGGTSLADVMQFARENRIHRPWLGTTISSAPGIYQAGVRVPRSLERRVRRP